jgi:hypothetical protein
MLSSHGAPCPRENGWMLIPCVPSCKHREAGFAEIDENCFLSVLFTSAVELK